MSQDVVLSVQNLSVVFHTPDGDVVAVNDVSFDLRRGETLGIVGESGSGKSVTASSILRLNNSNTATTTGSIIVSGVDVLTAQDSEVRRIRGSEVAMIFQDPLSALNPYYTVGKQIAEAYLVHHPRASKADARGVTLDMLKKVGIPSPEKRIDEFPHQFSGGMRQRIVIAIALINTPKVLIADEPTTALDVTVQAQVLELLTELRKEFNMAMILVTHDLGVVAGHTDKIAVMYAGDVVEMAPTRELFKNMKMPYTEALLKSIPRLETPTGTRLPVIEGRLPDPTKNEPGCPFANRCPYVADKCRAEKPPLKDTGTGHLYRCWFPIGGEK